MDIDERVMTPTIQAVMAWSKMMMRYHRHTVEGLEHFPMSGPLIAAVQHSFATYDGLLLGTSVYDRTGRWARSLGHDHLFRVWGVRRLVRELLFVPASHAGATEVLKRGWVIGVAPGGLRESLRTYQQRGQVDWGERKGFVRLAVATNTPIIVAVCPSADELYTVYPSRITEFAYAHWAWPAPIFRGWGPTLVPRPVKLTHYVSRAMLPPKVDPQDTVGVEHAVDEFHEQVCSEVQRLLARE